MTPTYNIRHSMLLFLALLFGVTGCAFNTLDSLKRGGEGGKIKVYDATYEDVQRSAVAALESVGFTIERQSSQIGEVLARGHFARGIACDANLVGLYLERVEPSKTRVEIQERFDGRTAGCQHMFQKIFSEINRELGEQRILAAAKRPAESVPSEAVVPPSDIDTLPSIKVALKKHAYAVVIGVETYREKLPKADFAAHDAKAVGEYLTKVMGYSEENVAVLLNDRATRTDVEKYIESWLPNRTEKDASVFIYFSGHGAPNPKTGDAYLVPYDGDPGFIDKTGYSLKRLYEQLAKLPAKQVIVMLDSCFSGAGGRSVIAQGMRPMGLSVEVPLLTGGRTVVLAASAGDQVSSTYRQKSHGLLTYFFLKGLQGDADRNRDGVIDLGEAFEYVKPQVERIARREFNNDQTPQLLGSPDLLTGGIHLVDRFAPK